jgi:hypothetical protein
LGNNPLQLGPFNGKEEFSTASQRPQAKNNHFLLFCNEKFTSTILNQNLPNQAGRLETKGDYN